MKEWFQKNWLALVLSILGLAVLIAVVVCFIKYPHFRDYCTSGIIGLFIGFISGYLLAIKKPLNKEDKK